MNTKPILSSSFPKASKPDLPLFGQDKDKKTLQAFAEQVLIQSGATPDKLKADWGVRLWTIRAKKNKLVLKLDTTDAPKTLDWKALKGWLQEILTPALGPCIELEIKDKSLKSCCHKGCNGCLADDKQKRKLWLQG